jgi:hypothetical protein
MPFFAQIKEGVDLAKLVFNINGNGSITELSKIVTNFPRDPAQLALKVITAIFEKELKKLDQKVVQQTLDMIKNTKDPNLKRVLDFIASHPQLVERVLGKGATTEPVSALAHIIARLV